MEAKRQNLKVSPRNFTVAQMAQLELKVCSRLKRREDISTDTFQKFILSQFEFDGILSVAR